MAKSSLHVVNPRKSQPELLDAKEIAREALEVCQQCREALRAFQAEEEMLLAHVYASTGYCIPWKQPLSAHSPPWRGGGHDWLVHAGRRGSCGKLITCTGRLESVLSGPGQ